MKIPVGLIALAVKLGPKFVAVGIKVIKGMKVGKVGLAAASAGAYAYLFTWEFAAVIMVMLFVHESGHVWAMKRCGIPTKGFYFIPFIGGAAVPERAFNSRWEEVYVAMMGPVWGWALSFAALILYWITKDPMIAAMASWMALINVFNLLPISPLDGGRVLKCIVFSLHSKTGLFVMATMLAVTAFALYHFQIIILALLLVVGFLEFVFEWKRRFIGPTRMHLNGVIVSSVWYVVVLGLLMSIIWLVADVPGTDLAMDLLRG